MQKTKNVNLAFSCKQDFGSMKPTSKGAFCQLCKKEVIDFRNLNETEITELLTTQNKVCGLFTTQQASVKTSKINWFKHLVASLLLSLGFSALTKDLYAQTTIEPRNTESKPDSLNFILGEMSGYMPVYSKGGNEGLYEFLSKNINYPKEKVSGKVIVSFTVDTFGNVIHAEIAKGLSPAANEETLRVVKLLKFTPGTEFGKKVEVKMILPIQFKPE
ncbi:MAG: hypothetical protein CFE21_14160 [Bacteroidetes bacterium B1(2017)]|nr:MAG: hypothetical protein CFE21_14160 [Bacteroidetes bacterium B1(2017)]